MNTTIPCTVVDDDETIEADTTIDVEAQWFAGWRETRFEPGEPAGYEVWSSRLNLTADLHAIVTDCARIQVEGGRPVVVSVNPDEWRRAEAVEIDDDDLHAALVAYLEE